MFDSLKSFFQANAAPTGASDDHDRLQVATCALLLEVAHSDDEFSAEERAKIMALVGRRFGMDADRVDELLHVADEERRSSGDLYRFARLIHDSYTRERRLAVIQLLWEVVWSDGVLAAHEDSLMHKMGKLLGIRHEELMGLKMQVRRSRED